MEHPPSPLSERERAEQQTPTRLTDLSLSPPQTVAAGVPAVLATAKKTLEEPGVMRGLRILTAINQRGGFDCSSCAWPDPEDKRSVAEFCENGAKAVADEATTKRVNAAFFAEHSIRELSLQSDHWLNLQGRLTEPMVATAGSNHYRLISWSDAFAKIGKQLRSLKSPDQATFYTSGRTSNEAAFLYQLFARVYGTNNLPDCSNMCHESSGVALGETIGIGKGTVTLEDFYQAELILIVGQNPGTNHPRMLTALEKAKRNGARIVSINPLPEAGLVRFKNPQDFMNPFRVLPTLLGSGTEMADLWLPVRLNGDVAVFKGLCKALLERDAVDRPFVEAHTLGFEALRADLEAEPWERIVAEGGIARDVLHEVAGWAAGTRKIIVCWAMGLTQHKNAVASIQGLVNLVLMRGAIGKPGAGLCPVRGHSNVQGDRTMGIWRWLSRDFAEALSREFSFAPPREQGLDVVGSIRAMAAGTVKVLVALGGNLLSAAPDTDLTADALRQCELTVQVSTKLNRSHLVIGREALILPCLGRTEIDPQGFVTVENSMGWVSSSRGVLPPASAGLLSEPAIVAGIAEATVGSANVDWMGLARNYARIREHVERVIPGFKAYNARAERGFYLPNGPREGTFPTPSRKAHFMVHPIPEWRLAPEELLMMTIRSHDQFNTTVYSLDDRYRGIHNERRVVLVNEEDVQRLRLSSGQVVDLESGSRRVSNFVIVPYPIPAGCCATYFPETNPLIPLDSVADKSHTPTSKSVVVRLVGRPA